MRCPSCNTENPGATDVCFKCGRSISAVTEGAVLNQRYKILAPLGKGGMGAVYKARDLDLEETVAIKLLRADLANDPVYSKRFRSEIKLARRVSHPNVCRIHEFGRDGPLSYIVMECVEGVDLRQILRQSGRLAPERAFDIAIQIADALQVIHAEGIIHRDLKTPNIMINDRKVAKLMDFGIARSLDSSVTGATVTGQIVGTPEYMSPEQARGERLDARSDVYALGIVIFELFTGDVPFRGDTPMATLFKHIQTPPPLDTATGLPAAMVPILRCALAKSAAERYQTAAELGQALRDARSQMFPEAVTASRAPTGTGTRPPGLPEAETMPRRAEDDTPTTPAPSAADGKTDLLPTPQPIRTPPKPPRAWVPSRPSLGSRATRPAATRSGSGRRAFALAAAGVGLVVIVALGVGGALLMRSWRSPVVGGQREPVIEEPPPTPAGTTAPAPVAAVLAPHAATPTATRPTRATPRPERTLPAATPTPRPVARVASKGRPARPPRPVVTPPPPTPAPSSVPTPVATPTPLPPTPSPREQPASPGVEATTRVAPHQATTGTLRVIVIPWAQVEVDGAVVGIFPNVKPQILKPGTHTVTLKHTDYEPLTREVTIRAGETTKLRVDLTKEATEK